MLLTNCIWSSLLMLYFSGAGIIKGVYLNLAAIEKGVEFKSRSKISEDEWAETYARLKSSIPTSIAERAEGPITSTHRIQAAKAAYSTP
jgi:hypothetical protein